MLTIGTISRLCGVKVPTIRFYEQIGLLQRPARTEGNRRVYSDADARRLRFIRHARELGFDIDDIRALLALAARPQDSCHFADSIAQQNLAKVEKRIEQLMALRDELRRMVDECRGGSVSECRVIEILGDHQHCLEDHPDNRAV
jgi:DNA-binding transcriptional MerR regulator